MSEKSDFLFFASKKYDEAPADLDFIVSCYKHLTTLQICVILSIVKYL